MASSPHDEESGVGHLLGDGDEDVGALRAGIIDSQSADGSETVCEGSRGIRRRQSARRAQAPRPHRQ
ncbi:hypothetical protein AB0L85_07870 [Streptomyces sp. NPDC052051]|uniref:hypothetical protein n=1 Tax=Streptomyces sp. NPDC052051 TaxID=3154649 RepID=UPI0034478F47